MAGKPEHTSTVTRTTLLTSCGIGPSKELGADVLLVEAGAAPRRPLKPSFGIRSKPEQIRQIAALLQFQDSLAELIAPTCRVGIGLLAGDDGPDRGIQCLLCKSRREVGDSAACRIRQRAAVDSGVSGSGEPLDPGVDAVLFIVEGGAERRT